MKIINMTEIRRDAYELGYDRFADTDEFDPENWTGTEWFTDSAEYANITLPRLRMLAGYKDGGRGTYTREARVIPISQEHADELAGDRGWISLGGSESGYILDELIDVWNLGVHDAVTGSEPPRDLSAI